MRFKEKYRAELFEMARSLSPLLGTLFQNPMDISDEDLNQELERVRRQQRLEEDRFQTYADHLGTALCFPELLKDKLE